MKPYFILNQTTMSLIETVQELNQAFDPDAHRQALDEKRNQACLEASMAILDNHEDKIKASAAKGQKVCRVYEWLHVDKLQFNQCYLRDLLNRGVLLERLQTVLDEKHGQGNFKIYYTVVGRTPQHRRYAILISWDKANFDSIDRLIKATRARFTKGHTRPRSGPNNSIPRECAVHIVGGNRRW